MHSCDGGASTPILLEPFRTRLRDSISLRRQVIKSDFATVTFLELEFEIPPRQRGEITTVEGLLRTSAERLGEAQDFRMEKAPEVIFLCGGGGD